MNVFKFSIWLLISQNLLLSAYARFVLYSGNGSEFNSRHTTPIMYLPQEDGFVEMKRLTVNFGRPLMELLAGGEFMKPGTMWCWIKVDVALGHTALQRKDTSLE
uniref:Secreted protein n=1 Tax=Bursaphelenchus xylophilus TaxID=6326 RepID=A0A1I7SI89_BURXY